MMRLYGIAGSRALRSIWAAEEVGVDFDLVHTHFMDESKTPEYLAINPNGRIPALVDGDLTLVESMAINLYLARKYGGDLYPSDGALQALAVQWSFWGITELEQSLLQILIHTVMLPEEHRDPARAETGRADLVRPLRVLDAALADREHLLAGDFTIADLNVASVLSMASMVRFDLSAYANADEWLGRCTSRPSLARAKKR